MTDRRSFLLGASALFGVAACGPQSETKSAETKSAEPKPAGAGAKDDAAPLARAKALIAQRPSLDLHAHPGLTFIRDAKNLSPSISAFSAQGAHEQRTIEDMRAGGMTAAVFCAVADFQVLDLAGNSLAPHRAFEPGEALASYRTQIGNLNRLAADGLVEKILTPDNVTTAKESGNVGAIFGVEGGDFLEGDASRIDDAYADGVRCINLVHYTTNALGDAMTGPLTHGGLTDAGADVVRAMNRTGMIIDVAHASEATAYKVLDISESPVICSHTHINTEAFSFPRFISRDLANAIASAGGVIGAWPAGIGISDLDGFVDRVFELIDAVGVDHVGVGTDMDGNYKPVWDNYRQFPDVVSKMLERGLSDDEAAKIIGGNGLRVFKAVARP